MQDRPTIHELLTAVQKFLDDEIVPSTTGRRQFLARVSANVLGQIDRELASEEAADRRTWQGLDDLLSTEAAPEARAERRTAFDRRLERLCERIRGGDFDAESSERGKLVGFLRQSIRDKLEVTNPALLAADATRKSSSGE